MFTPLTRSEKTKQVEMGLRPHRSSQAGRARPRPLSERMQTYCVPGVSIAVIENAALDWAKGYGTLDARLGRPVTPATLFHAGAVSKLVTAVAVLRLVADGVFDLDTDVNTWLKTWRVPQNDLTRENPVTLRRLLAHQSGIIDPECSFGTLRPGEPFPRPADILAGRTRFYPGPVSVTVEAECDFNYSDAGFCLIEQVMEDATGRSFEILVKSLVLAPLGMEDTLYQRDATLGGVSGAAVGHDRHGEPIEGERAVYPCLAATGLWSTPADLAKLLITLMHSLEGSGGLLPYHLAREMVTAHGGTAWSGLGVFVEGTGHDCRIFSQGWGAGFQCMVVAYPLLGTGAVVMTNSDPGRPQSHALTGEIMRAIGHAYRWPGHVDVGW